MTLLVPEKSMGSPGRTFPELTDALESTLQCLGAGGGWIGLQTVRGGLTFPVRVGSIPSSWLNRQQGPGSVWGVAPGGGPALLNELRPWPQVGDPPLHNLLSCPLIGNDQVLGHVVVANKPQGFVAQDLAVLQCMAHYMGLLLSRRLVPSPLPVEPAPAWRRILDRAEEAVLLLDASGTLIYANATWLTWTGFTAEELLGRTAPFPFWVNPEDLTLALRDSPLLPQAALPFRRSDHSLLWCLLETRCERWEDHSLTVAFLRLVTPPSQSPPQQIPADRSPQEEASPAAGPAPWDWLPLLLDLDGGIEGWGQRWEERTGLSTQDVEGSRSHLVLDWLFPQQQDRERVSDCFHQAGSQGCRLELEIATPDGGRLVFCTFLPWAAGASTELSRRWLLLVGEPVPSAALDGVISLPPQWSSLGPPRGPEPAPLSGTTAVEPAS